MDKKLPAAAETPAVTFVDRYLEKHISPHALTSNIKMNPLFPAPTAVEEDNVKVQPSWTVEDYNTRTCARLAEYLKVRGHGSRLIVRLCKLKGDKEEVRGHSSNGRLFDFEQP